MDMSHTTEVMAISVIFMAALCNVCMYVCIYLFQA